ncbi:MAG: hypothetical protein WCN98_14845, partial [Verrucomicrobiaceae bacterium]
CSEYTLRASSRGRCVITLHMHPNLHQLVAHVDDLVQPRPEQVLLAALACLPWFHRMASSTISGNTESQPRCFGNLEGSVRSRGTDDGSGTVRDLIEAGLNEPVDAASLWDLCCGACSG